MGDRRQFHQSRHRAGPADRQQRRQRRLHHSSAAGASSPSRTAAVRRRARRRILLRSRVAGTALARGSWLIQRVNINRTEQTIMATQTATTPESDQTVEKKIQRLRELYADAPEVGRAALETLIGAMKAAGTHSGQNVSQNVSQNETSAGRAGLRQGKVSELTTILKLVPGGAERIRAVLEAGRNLRTADRVGTLHDMRYVLLDNDTFLFATTYDGDWDPYIDVFATKITDQMDVIFTTCEGWPGIRSPRVKDWIVKHQIPAVGWYVAHPDLTVRD